MDTSILPFSYPQCRCVCVCLCVCVSECVQNVYFIAGGGGGCVYKSDILKNFLHILQNGCTEFCAHQMMRPKYEQWAGWLAVRLHLTERLRSGHVTKCVRSGSTVTDLTQKYVSLFHAFFFIIIIIIILSVGPLAFRYFGKRGTVNYL